MRLIGDSKTHFYTQEAVQLYNLLTEDPGCGYSVSRFTKRLDEFVGNRSVYCYQNDYAVIY